MHRHRLTAQITCWSSRGKNRKRFLKWPSKVSYHRALLLSNYCKLWCFKLSRRNLVWIEIQKCQIHRAGKTWFRNRQSAIRAEMLIFRLVSLTCSTTLIWVLIKAQTASKKTISSKETRSRHHPKLRHQAPLTNCVIWQRPTVQVAKNHKTASVQTDKRVTMLLSN